MYYLPSNWNDPKKKRKIELVAAVSRIVQHTISPGKRKCLNVYVLGMGLTG